jgi:hypothetical protein
MTHAPDAARALYLVKLGGSLGIASSFIGLAIFLAGMFGVSAVFMLSILPLALGGVGMVITIVGSMMHTPGGPDETAPIAAIFCCLFGVIFGAIEWYIWMAPAATTGAAAH